MNNKKNKRSRWLRVFSVVSIAMLTFNVLTLDVSAMVTSDDDNNSSQQTNGNGNGNGSDNNGNGWGWGWGNGGSEEDWNDFLDKIRPRKVFEGTDIWEIFRFIRDGLMQEGAYVLFGQTKWVSNSEFNGREKTCSSDSSEGNCWMDADDLSEIDVDLDPSKILAGTTIFGVTGTLELPSMNAQCGEANGGEYKSSTEVNAAGLCSTGAANAVSGSGPWDWTCAAPSGGASVDCSASVSTNNHQSAPKNGVCGAANGYSFSAKSAVSAAGLCSVGAASSVSGSGPWTWNCSGIDGGDEVDCSADFSQDGECGEYDGTNQYSAPSEFSQKCLSGIVDDFEWSESENSWSWKCVGVGGGQTDECSTGKKIDAVCGSANGETLNAAPETSAQKCSAGAASVIAGSGPWAWMCAGVNGGTNSGCSAEKEEATNGSGGNTTSQTGGVIISGDPDGPIGETGEMQDSRDDEIYNWAKMADGKIWMTQNLRTTQTTSGDSLSKWAATVKKTSDEKLYSCPSAIFSRGNNSINEDCNASFNGSNPLGYYYQWSAAQDACPSGWHLPTELEWENLEESIADDETCRSIWGVWHCNPAGTKMKSPVRVGKGAGGAYDALTEGDNSSGFDGLLAGQRGYYYSDYGYRGWYGFFWTDTAGTNSGNAYYRYLYSGNTGVGRSEGPATSGFSVRCVRD